MDNNRVLDNALTSNPFPEVEKMSLPKGGGAYQGLKEEFEADLFNGEGHLEIPIYTSPCRGCEPKLVLSYSTSDGNGVFGLGFSLNLSFISRKTSQHIPKYDSTDCFIFAGQGELVLLNTEKTDGDTTKSVFSKRKEDSFSYIEYFESANVSFWKVTDRENTVSYYGINKQSRIENPDNHDEVFAWLLSETIDEKGNCTAYHYGDNNQIESIQYGNSCFSIEFQYKKNRKDTFFDCTCGFMRKTDVLCSRIQMVHHLEEKTRVVRTTEFFYHLEQGISLLEKVCHTGFKNIANEEASMQTPTLYFSYTPFLPENYTVSMLQTDNQIPFKIEEGGFLFADLYGEGIPGLLYSDGKQAVYCRPLGEGNYETPQLIENFPIHRELKKKEYSFTSLEGNGKYELVVRSQKLNGFYECQHGFWQPFTAFSKYANEQASEWMETANLQGDGLRHLLITNGQELKYYPSLKKEGVDMPRIQNLPADFPHTNLNSPTEVVAFLDMFGDGLSHRVRIRNGMVECFPNIGYGRFGEKIEFSNPPIFEGEMDSSRLYFADLDGSGTIDFIYVYTDRVDIFFNPCGCYFMDPVSVLLPEPFSKADRLHFEDVKGIGTNCMIYSKLDQTCRHYCFDFNGARKPYLLKEINPQRGNRIRLSYETSVSFYLKDRQKHIKWEQIPPFPIALLSQVITIDEISGCAHKTAYHYRNGLYDVEERQFQGFGMIEQWDFECPLKTDGQQYQEERIWTKTLYTKKWFDTGLEVEKDFYHEGKWETMQTTEEYIPSNSKEACKVLWGKVLCEEFYDPDKEQPGSVRQLHYKVKELRAPETDRHGVYFACVLSEMNYECEGEPADPMIRQEFTVETDDFGNTIKSCSIWYPRKYKGEADILVQVNQYINQTETGRHLGVLEAVQYYEIGGVSFEGNTTLHELQDKLDAAMKQILPYGIAFTPGREQARLEGWRRIYYWNDEQTKVLPPGTLEGRVLVHHEEEAAFSEGFSAVEGKLTTEQLRETCGYLLKDGYWWKTGSINYYYDSDRFYLPWKKVWPKPGNVTSLVYDTYCLLPTEIVRGQEEGLQLRKQFLIDYTALEYWQERDENHNIRQAFFDPLGRVAAVTSYGEIKEDWDSKEKRVGNQDITDYQYTKAETLDVLADPEAYLQGVSAFYFYDMLSYQKRKQPCSSICIEREEFLSSSSSGSYRLGITYLDGAGRVLEEKRQLNDRKWEVEDKTFYNTADMPVQTYPAFYTAKPEYENDEESLLPPPIRMLYDYKKRKIRTEIPCYGLNGKGFGYLHTKTEYSTWQQTDYDENHCLFDSDYYQKFMEEYPNENPTQEQEDRKFVLQKGLKFGGKAKIVCIDSHGNEITAHFIGEETSYEEITYDIRERVIKAADARLRKAGVCNFAYTYDMTGSLLYVESCDAGNTLTLENEFGEKAIIISPDQTTESFEYDCLLRPVKRRIEGIGTVEKTEYGESQEDAEQKNLNGQIYRKYDQSGIETFHSYSLHYLISEKTTQLCRKYDADVNWESENELEQENYQESFSYNMAYQVTRQKTPDGAVYLFEYDSLGRLRKNDILEEEKRKTLVEDIVYLAGGKRSSILYGNRMEIAYRYDRSSLRMEGMAVIRDREGKKERVQNFDYYYDSVGNLTRIRDKLGNTVVYRGQIAEPVWDYTYDCRYQMISASGREGAGADCDMEALTAYQREYTYDESHNLIKMKHTSLAKGFTKTLTREKVSNRMNEIKGMYGSEELPFTAVYDARGNLTNLPDKKTLQWNYDGRLVYTAIIDREQDGNDEEFYIYNHAGQRKRKVSRRMAADGRFETTDRIYLGNYHIKKVSNGQLTLHCTTMQIAYEELLMARIYRWVKDVYNREGSEGEERIHYQTADWQNSVAAEYNEKAECIHREEFYPFGETALVWHTKSEVPLRDYGYCGKELDFATGFYYYGGRYYAPVFGCMVSADAVQYAKLEDGKTWNLFSYCLNNPVFYTDPDGHCPKGTKEPLITDEEARRLLPSSLWPEVGLVATLPPPQPEQLLYHYTTQTGYEGIQSSHSIFASTKAKRPADARHGSGQYFTDVAPEDMSPEDLSQLLYNNLNQTKNLQYYVALPLSEFTRVGGVGTGAEHIFIVPGETDLDISGLKPQFGENRSAQCRPSSRPRPKRVPRPEPKRPGSVRQSGGARASQKYKTSRFYYKVSSK